MGAPDHPDLHDSYYADLTIEREDAMPQSQSAGTYSWVSPKLAERRRPDPPPVVVDTPPVDAFDAETPTTRIPRPPAASIEEAVLTLLSAPPAKPRDRDVDPCNCAFCKEGRANGVLYVQYDGSTVLRPLALVAEVAEVAGADPMRFCPFTDKVVDRDAPAIAPWTTDASDQPVCCKPLRRAVDVERADIPPFGDTISFTGGKGYLLVKQCPWCGTSAAKIIQKSVGR